MTETSIVYNVVKSKTGIPALTPLTEGDAERRKAFLFSQLDAINAGEKITIKAEMCVIGKDATERHIIRDSIYTYYGRVISDANESFTNQFTGTKEQRKKQLHINLKNLYCQNVHPEYYRTITVYDVIAKTMRDVQIYFTLGDTTKGDIKQRKLTTPELREYRQWVYTTLYDMTKVPWWKEED